MKGRLLHNHKGCSEGRKCDLFYNECYMWVKKNGSAV